jgi:hypothetical protein
MLDPVVGLVFSCLVRFVRVADLKRFWARRKNGTILEQVDGNSHFLAQVQFLLSTTSPHFAKFLV